MDSLYERSVLPQSNVASPQPNTNAGASNVPPTAPTWPPPPPEPSASDLPPATLNRPRIWLSIIVTMVVLVFAAGVGFMLGREHPDESLLAPVVTPTAVPFGPSATPTPPPNAGITFDGEFIKFIAPSDWKPVDINPEWGEVNEKVSFGIPLHNGDQSLAFLTLSAPYDKPTYVYEESPIMIGGIEGIKWKGRGDTFVSFDYVTKVPTKNGLFSLHVTTDKDNPILEQQLDDLVKTIIFKPE